VDSYLRLDLKEEKKFQTEIDTMGIGKKEAIMQTMTSWEEKGMEKERRTIALNMLKDDFSLEQISRLTGLSLAQLQKLQAEI
jgi:predicted transposase YdaD